MSTNTADHLAYQRSTSVSVWGLVLQFLALGVVALAYGITAGDTGAISGGTLIMLGLPIWGSLALLFNQHRLERLEALEQESYRRSSLVEASVFEEGARGQAVQHERLAWMHRWLLPTISVLMAAGYLGVGIFRLSGHTGGLSEPTFVSLTFDGWAIGVGAWLAFIGFIFARFVSGMAKQPIWSPLNAGAAAAVVAAIVGVLLAVAHFIAIALGSDLGLRYFPVVVDVLMILLGVEVILNFILTAYRPRKPGEYVRPAFDSRVLAFVAAPDRLAQSISEAVNYQFGFNVSSTWFYKLIARSFVLLVLLGLIVGWSLTSFTIVKPDERALILQNGRITGEGDTRIAGPGLKLHWPWPISQVLTFPADGLNQIQAGDDPSRGPGDAILWTEERTDNPAFFVVRASAEVESAGATSGPGSTPTDIALLIVEVPVHYRVRDLERYLLLAQDAPPVFDEEVGGRVPDPERFRREFLRSLAEREVTELLRAYTTREVLSSKRAELIDEIRERIQTAYDNAHDGRGTGVELTFAGVVGAQPNADVAGSFEEVIKAESQRQAALESAERDAIGTLAQVAGDVGTGREIVAEIRRRNEMVEEGAGPDAIAEQESRIRALIRSAGGRASELLAGAAADRWETHLTERTRLIRNNAQSELFEAAPAAFKMNRYLTALRAATGQARVWITAFPTRVRYVGEETQVDISEFVDTFEQ
ncbi:MAG: SPFH domain-containing protein [Planctomycetota bacterium]